MAGAVSLIVLLPRLLLSHYDLPMVVGALVYNLLARWLGGIELVLDRKSD